MSLYNNDSSYFGGWKKRFITFERRSKFITIYGPYYPEEQKARLKKIGNYLRDNDFLNTNLVEDYPDDYFPFEPDPDDDINNYKRSNYCVRTSHLNIFIFTFEGQKSGESFELYESMRINPNYLIFCEKIEKISEDKTEIIYAHSTIIEGVLKIISKNIISFPKNDDDYLCDVVFNRVRDFFLIMY